MPPPEKRSEVKKPPQWQLTGIKREGLLVINIPLTIEQELKIPDYRSVLKIAASSQVALPVFSNYFVKEAIGPVGGKKYPAGNIEYGHLQALHGEESAIVALRMNYPDYTGDVVLGIIAGEEGNIASPCGNCRDIMLDTMNGQADKLHIVSSAQNGGLAIVTDLRSYLFDEYREITEKDRDSLLPILASEIEYIKQNLHGKTYDPYSPPNHPYPDRLYTVGISNGRNNIFVGGHQVDAAYHPTYALENAISQAEDDVSIDHVLILSSNPDGKPPHVMYRDRQRLFEQNQKQEDILGTATNPRILLINNNGQGEIKIWRTTIKEWLPLPFSSDNFGSFRNEIRKYNISTLQKRG